MNKVKAFFKWLVKLIVTPIAAIVTIPISDRFINFINKHIWLRILISGAITAVILAIIYIVRG